MNVFYKISSSIEEGWDDPEEDYITDLNIEVSPDPSYIEEDEDFTEGAFQEFSKTFPSLWCNLLSENFAEIDWNDPKRYGKIIKKSDLIKEIKEKLPDWEEGGW